METFWALSQIRTFEYAPYNNKRQTRDADRMGIEKGSVFCIKGTTSSETEQWVGSYQNEGFGKVLINPAFLEFTGDLGKAKFEIKTKQKEQEPAYTVPNPDLEFGNQVDSRVWKYLIKQSNETKSKSDILSEVNSFVGSSFGKSFEGKDKYASQWGTILLMATQLKTKNSI